MDVWIQDGARPVKQHLEVLWVRWLAVFQDSRFSMKNARLPKVGFVEEADQDAFGFLNPGQVIRGVHLIPAFAAGQGVSRLRPGKSLARPDGQEDDWEEHYIGM
jgi:hypothetical protein